MSKEELKEYLRNYLHITVDVNGTSGKIRLFLEEEMISEDWINIDVDYNPDNE